MIYFFALNEIDICNFSDDKTPYVCGSKLKSVVEKQDHNFEIAIAWFEMNCVKLKLTNVICWYQEIEMNVWIYVGQIGSRHRLRKW